MLTRLVHCRCGRSVECHDIRNTCTCGREYNLSGRRVDADRHLETENWLLLSGWTGPFNEEVLG